MDPYWGAFCRNVLKSKTWSKTLFYMFYSAFDGVVSDKDESSSAQLPGSTNNWATSVPGRFATIQRLAGPNVRSW